MTISLDDIIGAAAEVQADLAKDDTLLTHLYLDKGWGMAKIGRHVGLHRSTVYRRLEAAGVYRGPGKPGPPPKEFCLRNHELAKTAAKRPDGSRYCTECRRIRERVGGEEVDDVGFVKHGAGEILPESEQEQKTASANWTEGDRAALAEENEE